MSIRLNFQNKTTKKQVFDIKEEIYLEDIKTVGNPSLDGWSDMLILGDNFYSLHALCRMPEISGNVRLVYIDPPFSTNSKFRVGIGRTSTVSSSQSDDLAYSDELLGERYLAFLMKRFMLLKELMSDDGSIYVHIDCKIGHYVKVLLDEVFDNHFINDITRIKCNPKNFDRKAYGNQKDMILFYSKTDDYLWNDSRTELSADDVKRLYPKVDKNGRRYTTTPLHAPGETKDGPTGQAWEDMLPPKGRHWRYKPSELTELDKKGLIEWSSTGNPRKIRYAKKGKLKGKKRQDIWNFKDPAYPIYPTEKNIDMLKVIVSASSNPGDIVLDCFAGSGTTLIAAQQLGRRWIGIDQSEMAIEKIEKKLEEEKGFHPYMLFRTVVKE